MSEPDGRGVSLMNAVGFTEFGGPEVLRIVSLPVPVPGPGQVLVRVAAAAVNPTDLAFRAGGHRSMPPGVEPPYVPGMDLAGVVDALGPGVTGWSPGDRVMAAVSPWAPGGGTQAEYVAARIRQVSPAGVDALLDAAVMGAPVGRHDHRAGRAGAGARRDHRVRGRVQARGRAPRSRAGGVVAVRQARRAATAGAVPRRRSGAGPALGVHRLRVARPGALDGARIRGGQRGYSWHSGGDATFLSPEEAWRGHDLVEWAGTQSWSNGRVGLSGVSYLTSKWGYYYSDEGLRRQQAFFDHFLLGRDTEISHWPRVRYQVRDGGHAGRWRTAAGWPVPGSSYQPLYLDAAAGMLTRTRPAVATVSYDSERSGRGRGRATFDFRFSAATEAVGGMKLRVWMSAPDADDLDVFVAVQKLDRYGNPVGFPFYAVFEDGPVALGWIRASHRELDQARSAPWQPVLAHRRELRLAAGEIVPLEIEILPSGTLFRPGETLRLVIQGTDVYRYPRPLIQALHDDSVNRGTHVVHGGGEYDSHLLMPVAPAGAG